MNVHKNARVTVHGRLLLMRRVRAHGLRVEAAPLTAVVSVRPSYKWLARHRAGGEDNRITTTSLTTRTMVAVPNLG